MKTTSLSLKSCRPPCARINATTASAWSGLRGGCRRWRWKCLKFFAGLETHGLAGRDAHLLPGARVAADAGLPRLHVEYAEAPQLDAVSPAQGVFHGLEHSFHRLFSLRPGDVGFRHNSVNDVELDHTSLQLQRKPMLDRGLQVVKRRGV